MIRPSLGPRAYRLLVAVVGSAGLLAYGLGEEWKSVERANRLYRNGDFSTAAEIYERHLEGETHDPGLHHNRGTALVRLGFPEEANAELQRSLESLDPEVVSRAQYNLGYQYLAEALQMAVSDSMGRLLAASFGANLNTLRLTPEASDARWNLAVTQQLLDSLLGALAMSSVEDEGEGDEPGGEIGEVEWIEGEEETEAEGDAGPLEEGEAFAILASMVDDPAELVRRILWLEGPRGWAWRVGGSVPGGRW